jgi:sodium/potassium-transporting ATPase subunit alpha
MDAPSSDPEKSPNLDKDIQVVPVRTVAFPEDEPHRDEKHRPVGVEMKRQMTEEDARLAAAGYEHLTKEKPGPGETKFGDVDITEHSLPIHEIEALLHTSFNWNDPAQSSGLSTAEAEARLKRDGPNALTPPKKKSALQKVCICATF